MISEVENKIFMNNEITIGQDKIKDLNLNISLTSSHLHLVKQIPITDVNDVATLLLSIVIQYC